uniref:Uncharacterized protein n=1 Tax=Caenorhabditis japonica TaxID=281687 RepID=A0A8R1IKT4_CAEJA
MFAINEQSSRTRPEIENEERMESKRATKSKRSPGRARGIPPQGVHPSLFTTKNNEKTGRRLTNGHPSDMSALNYHPMLSESFSARFVSLFNNRWAETTNFGKHSVSISSLTCNATLSCNHQHQQKQFLIQDYITSPINFPEFFECFDRPAHSIFLCSDIARFNWKSCVVGRQIPVGSLFYSFSSIWKLSMI